MRSAVTTVAAAAGAATEIAAAAASKMNFMTFGSPPLNVNHPPECGEDAFVHHLRKRRVREDGLDEIGFDQLGGFADGVALDELGDLGADHVRAEQFAGLGVEYRLDEALDLA